MTRSTMLSIVLLSAFTFAFELRAADLNGTWEVHMAVPGKDKSQDGCFQMSFYDEGEKVRVPLADGSRWSGTEGADGSLELEFKPTSSTDDWKTLPGSTVMKLHGDVNALEGTMTAVEKGKSETVQVSAKKISSQHSVSRDTVCDGRIDQAADGKAEKSVAELCEMFGVSWAVAKLTESLTKKAFVAMNPCGINRNGRGFYLLGNSGPGARDYLTSTVYVPVHATWKFWETFTCKQYDYGFTIKAGPKLSTVGYIEKYGGYIAPFIGGGGTAIAVELFKKFQEWAGLFAVSASFHPHALKYHLYLSIDNKKFCETEAVSNVIQAIRAAFTSNLVPGFTLGGVDCGSDIPANFGLAASPVPAVGCSHPVIFMYLFGTRKVTYW